MVLFSVLLTFHSHCKNSCGFDDHLCLSSALTLPDPAVFSAIWSRYPQAQGPQTNTGSHSRRWVTWWSCLLIFTATPYGSHYHQSFPSGQMSSSIRFSWELELYYELHMWRIWVASFLMRIQSLQIWSGTEPLGRGCKSRLSLAERIDQLLAGSYQKLNSEGQVTMVSLFHCILQCNNDRNKVLNKCNELESSGNHAPISICEKTVFHERDSWWQKGWAWLIYGASCFGDS